MPGQQQQAAASEGHINRETRSAETIQGLVDKAARQAAGAKGEKGGRRARVFDEASREWGTGGSANGQLYPRPRQTMDVTGTFGT